MAAFASLPQVKSLVPDSIFKRAKELASANKFRDIRFEGPRLEKCFASCLGSNEGDTYSLSIVIKAESSSKPVCECSCPAAAKARGNLCKHVVALLLLRIKEVVKVSQQQTDALMPSELNLPEDKVSQSSLSADTQATEPFVQCGSVAMSVDDEICSPVLASSNVIENRKRALPSWISGGFSVGKKKVEENGAKRGASKRIKSNATTDLNVEKDESKICIGADDRRQKASESKRGKEEGIAVGREGRSIKENNRELAKKRKLSSVKSAPKRRKTKVYVESDLSEEDEPEVIDSYSLSSNDLKDKMDLTSEDLLNMAKEHLEMENSNENQECGIHENDQVPLKTSAVNKKGSIFSVEGWNEVAAKTLDAKNSSFSREIFGKPDLAMVSPVAVNNKDESFKQNSQAKEEHLLTMASPAFERSDKVLESMEPADNVVDDMLGLFFGPSLSKAVTSKAVSTQAMTEDLTRSIALPEHSTLEMDLTIHADSAPRPSSTKAVTTKTEYTQALPEEMTRSITHPEHSAPEIGSPINSDSVPRPKKKGSLKDKVMMFLG